MTTKLRLCIVEPMLGRNPGWVTSQEDILSDLFREVGYQVLEISSVKNRLTRLLDLSNTQMLAEAVNLIIICHEISKKVIIYGNNLARVIKLDQRSSELINLMKEYLFNRKGEN